MGFYLLAGLVGAWIGAAIGFLFCAVLVTGRGPHCPRCGGQIKGSAGCFHT